MACHDHLLYYICVFPTLIITLARFISCQSFFFTFHIKHGSGVLATPQESLKGLGVAPQSLQQLVVSIRGEKKDEGWWNHLRGIIQPLGRYDTREPDN